jgi:hypothetical protein
MVCHGTEATLIIGADRHCPRPFHRGGPPSHMANGQGRQDAEDRPIAEH